MKLTGSGILALAGLIVGAILFFYLWAKKDKITELLNPASNRNIVSLGAGKVVETVTGGAAAGGEDTVGGLLARAREWLSGDTAKIDAMKNGTPQDHVKPTSPQCVWCELGSGAGFDPNPIAPFNPYAINPRSRT